MPAQPRSTERRPHPHGARVHPAGTIRRSVTPHEIAAVIDDLAASIKADANCDLYAGWALAAFASKLGIAVAISSSASPSEVIGDLGGDWADAISRALDEHPDKTGQVLRAAMGVIEKIAEDVKGRGLAG